MNMNKLKSLTLAAIFMVSAGAQAGWFSSDEEIKGNYPYQLNSYLTTSLRDYWGEPNSQGGWWRTSEHPITNRLFVQGSPKSNKIMYTSRRKQFKTWAGCKGNFIVSQVHIKRKYPELSKKAIIQHKKAVMYLELNDGTNSLILACGKDKRLDLVFKINKWKAIVEQEKRELAQEDY